MRLKCEYGLVLSSLGLLIIGNSFTWVHRIGISFAVIFLIMLFFVEKKWKSCLNNCNGKKIEPVWKTFRESQRTNSFGLWCIFLIPAAIFMSNGLSDDFWILSMLFIPVLIFIFVITLSMLKSTSVLPFAVAAVISFAFNLTICFVIFNIKWYWSILISFGLLYSGTILPVRLINYFSKCFTYGEFTIIWQSFVLIMINSVKFLLFQEANGDVLQSFISLANLFLFAFVVSCCMYKNIWLNLFLVCILAITTSYVLLQQDYVLFMVQFLLKDKIRLFVLSFWLLNVLCTVHFVTLTKNRPSLTLTTVDRKFFHLTISFVTLSGLIYDPELTYFASVLIFYSFVIAELIRYLNAPPFGECLNETLKQFLDYQDQGSLILTPVYLLAACFLPLWLIPCRQVSSVRFVHFAGFVCVGVGDAAASVGGTIFGRRKPFKKSGKTLEGAFCCLLAQIISSFFVLYLITGKSMFSSGSDLYLLSSCLILSLLETFLIQVDNLVLPLVAFVLFLNV